MRTTKSLAYGAKEAITFKGETRKRVSLKRTAQGEFKVLIERAIKNIGYGYTVVDKFVSSPIQCN